ncbi:MAG: hypothetical protein AAF805_00835 [Planctomycetota bacterium]
MPTARWTPARLALLAAAALVFTHPGLTYAQAVAEAADEASMDEEGDATVAVVALSGYDALMADADFLGELAGQPGVSGVAEMLLAMSTGGRGVEGLDKSQPIGVVLQTDGAAFAPVVCLPITDLESLLELADMRGMAAEQDEDGIYRMPSPQGQEVFFFDEQGWVFLGPSVEALDAAPEDPSGMLVALLGEHDLSIELMPQAVPAMYRQIAVEQLRAGMQEGLERQDEETDEAYETRKRLAEAQIDQLTDLIEGLEKLAVGLAIDGVDSQVYVDVELVGVEGSDMAVAMAAYEDATTDFAAFHRPDAAMSLLASAVTPPELLEKQKAQLEAGIATIRVQLDRAIDEAVEATIDDGGDETEFRDLLEGVTDDLIDAYRELVTSGRADLAMSLDLSGGGFDLIAGGYLPNPEKVESALKRLEEAAQKQATKEGADDTPGVAWGYAEHSGVTLHKLEAPIPADADQARAALGDSLVILMGVAPERVYLAAGPRAEESLKSAIDESAARSGELSGSGEFLVDVQAVLEAVEPLVEGEASNILAVMLEAMDKAPEGKGRILVETEPVSRGVRVRYLLEEGVLRGIAGFAAQAAANAQQGQGF